MKTHGFKTGDYIRFKPARGGCKGQEGDDFLFSKSASLCLISSVPRETRFPTLHVPFTSVGRWASAGAFAPIFLAFPKLEVPFVAVPLPLLLLRLLVAVQLLL